MPIPPIKGLDPRLVSSRLSNGKHNEHQAKKPTPQRHSKVAWKAQPVSLRTMLILGAAATVIAGAHAAEARAAIVTSPGGRLRGQADNAPRTTRSAANALDSVQGTPAEKPSVARSSHTDKPPAWRSVAVPYSGSAGKTQDAGSAIKDVRPLQKRRAHRSHGQKIEVHAKHQPHTTPSAEQKNQEIALQSTIRNLRFPSSDRDGPIDIHILVHKNVEESNDEIRRTQINDWMRVMGKVLTDTKINIHFHRDFDAPVPSGSEETASADMYEVEKKVAQTVMDNPDTMRTDKKTKYLMAFSEKDMKGDKVDIAGAAHDGGSIGFFNINKKNTFEHETGHLMSAQHGLAERKGFIMRWATYMWPDVPDGFLNRGDEAYSPMNIYKIRTYFGVNPSSGKSFSSPMVSLSEWWKSQQRRTTPEPGDSRAADGQTPSEPT